MQRARDAAQDRHAAGAGASPAARNNAATAASWPMPSSTTRWPLGASSRRACRRNGAIGSRVRRCRRRARGADRVAHLRRERRDVAARDVGRVGDDEIERRRQRRAEVAGDEMRARAKPERAGVVARDRASAAALMSVPTPVAFGNSVSSASSSAPEPVPRSTMRSARLRGPPRRARRAPPRPRSRCPAAAPACRR